MSRTVQAGVRWTAMVVAAVHVFAGTAACFPPQAMRKSPPVGIERRAIAVGAAFPKVEVETTQGVLGLESGKRHVLVFYRGDW